MDTTIIHGEYTTARILLPNSEIEDALYEQVEEYTDSKACTEPITMMPDAHFGRKGPIGFTMPLPRDPLRIIPNLVGVDVGCGMTSILLKERVYDDLDQEKLDQDIREAVPVGTGNVNSGGYHLHNEFPFGECNVKLRELTKNLDREAPDWFDGYDPDYFDDLCKRCGININYAINSMGSLGGGNHFIEIGEIPKKDGWSGKLQRLFGRDWYNGEWVTVHSGSRKIGENVAEYWQERAHENCDNRAEILRERFADYPGRYFKWDSIDALSDTELIQWATGGMGEDFLVMEAIRDDYIDTNPEMIEQTRNDIKRGIHDMPSDGTPLDYLEGEEAMGYLVDMIFAQTYAEQSRQIIAERVVDQMGGEIDQRFNSTHNYIDMDDLTIRKGATRLHKGEFAIVPMNMRDGVFLLEGRGNSQYNDSICHGAGRPYSRSEAERRYGDAEVDRMNQEIFSTHIPIDELPEAYKDTATVKPYIEEGAKIVGEIEVLHNIKG